MAGHKKTWSNGVLSLSKDIISMKGKWTVYILKCSDDSFYVGHTEDLEKRISLHNSGRGAAYTAVRRPVVLVYHEVTDEKSVAMRREKQIKGWSKAKKEALIRRDIELLKNLARSHSD
jgi:predicted GIY-YIG superfamily endonuclease